MSTKNLLPELTDFKPYQEALEQETKAQEALDQAREAAAEAAAAAQDADAGGADYKNLAGLKEAAAEAKRAQELAGRDLEAATFNSKEHKKAAETEIKAQAREHGKKIIKRIATALTALENAQMDYIELTRELRQKVKFPRPFAENESVYTGPDPGPVYNPMDFKVSSWKNSAEIFSGDRPARDNQEPEAKAEMPGGFVLT